MDVYLEILIPVNIIRGLRRCRIAVDENVEITDPVCKSIIFQSIRSAVGRHSWSIVCAKLCIFFRYVPVYEIVGDTVGCPDYVECFVGIIRIIDDCKVF